MRFAAAMNSVLLCLILVETTVTGLKRWNEATPKNDEKPVYDYNGFQSCNEDGWYCTTNNGLQEIIFECSAQVPTARIWIWTARLPERTSIFTVRNCQGLEVHVDCTRGSRTSQLIKFNATNIGWLKILHPTRPGYYLHDNIDSVLLPQVFHLQNIQNLYLFPGLYSVPDRECENTPASPSDFTLFNVTIPKIPSQMVDGYTFNKFTLENVSVKTVGGNAISLTASEVSIINSTFSDLGPKAFQLVAKENVTIKKNSFTKLSASTLVVRSKIFEFIENRVQEIATQAMDVLAFKIAITGNSIAHMDTRALESVTFAYVTPIYETATKFQYNFTKNIIWSLEPGSLHPNWISFVNACSIVVVEDNQFDCSCTNFGWITMSHALGPKILKFRDFYEEKILRGNHNCLQNKTCSFPMILERMSDMCANKTDIRKVCSQPPIKVPILSDADVSKNQQQPLKATAPIQEAQKSRPVFVNPPVLETDYQEPDYSKIYHSENQALNKGKPGRSVWYTVIPVVAVIAITSLALALWWYKRSDRQHDVSTVYKNHVENDDDNPIVINEHNNQLYHERN